MKRTYYTIKFTSTVTTWDYTSGSTVVEFDTVKEASEVIKHYFENESITNATIFEHTKAEKVSFRNADPELEKAKDKMLDALMSVSLDKRKKLITNFYNTVVGETVKK